MSRALSCAGIQGDVILSKGKARLFEDGNPLVYSGAISETISHGGQELRAGDLVAVKDYRHRLIGWYGRCLLNLPPRDGVAELIMSDPRCDCTLQRVLQPSIHVPSPASDIGARGGCVRGRHGARHHHLENQTSEGAAALLLPDALRDQSLDTEIVCPCSSPATPSTCRTRTQTASAS